MVRTVIALEADDKAWLDRRAAEQGISMTEVVRQAVKLLRQTEQAPTAPSYDHLLDRLVGTWRQGDGLQWQHALRDEWERDAAGNADDR